VLYQVHWKAGNCESSSHHRQVDLSGDTSFSTKTTASASTSAPAKNNKTQADLLAELMKRIEDQDAQIKALKASF
jgi:hypothetical protein